MYIQRGRNRNMFLIRRGFHHQNNHSPGPPARHPMFERHLRSSIYTWRYLRFIALRAMLYSPLLMLQEVNEYIIVSACRTYQYNIFHYNIHIIGSGYSTLQYHSAVLEHYSTGTIVQFQNIIVPQCSSGTLQYSFSTHIFVLV